MTPKRLRLSNRTLMPSAASADRASGVEPREGAMGARQKWRLPRTTVPPLWIGIVVAAVFIVVETLLVLLLRHRNPGEAFEPIYLFGVVVVSAVWGLGLALATSLASVGLLAYFWPGHFEPFSIANGVVVVIFLAVASLTSFVAGVARRRAIEAEESREKVSLLAGQQAALRRVATLVARGVDPSEVFAAVADEMARCLDVDSAEVCRYEPDGAAIVVAAFAERGVPHMLVGDPLTLEGDNVVGTVLRTGRAARMNHYAGAAGSATARSRERGLRSRVGAPITVGDRVWGLAVVGWSRSQPLPPDTEERITDFAELVATALANAATRAELIASRARIVTAADDGRRRLERDLHDGAQQRLVALGLQLRMAEESTPPEMHEQKQHLSQITSALTDVSNDLQELSRGIHPSILAKGGLHPALKTLARRSVVPVTLDIAIERRLPEATEVAAYYVVAEALTNADKHAQASEVTVGAHADHVNLCLLIRDDGIGGADSRNGSGLIGLKDRVEALGGHIQIVSHPGSGTSLDVTIPLPGP
jgi:signal transduction histidine kinase